MRITPSENYEHTFGCGMDGTDCDRHYCNEHRILWRDCDTAVTATDGAGQSFFEMRDCPQCEAESKAKKYYARIVAQFPDASVCPKCCQVATDSADTAIHLVERHGMEAEEATVWLRGQVQPKAFGMAI